jgi:hypothetical protein
MKYPYKCFYCETNVERDRPDMKRALCPQCGRVMGRVWEVHVMETEKFSTKTRRGNEEE